jgi:hypothetical protein
MGVLLIALAVALVNHGCPSLVNLRMLTMGIILLLIIIIYWLTMDVNHEPEPGAIG